MSEVINISEALVNTSPGASGLCEKCGLRVAEYGLQGQKPLSIEVEFAPEKKVKTHFTPGKLCESCLEPVLLQQAELAQLRAWYRFDGQRREVERDWAVCADCGNQVRQFLCVDSDQSLVCQRCLYVRLRDQMLASVVRIPDTTAYRSAVVSVIASARREARSIFESVWA